MILTRSTLILPRVADQGVIYQTSPTGQFISRLDAVQVLNLGLDRARALQLDREARRQINAGAMVAEAQNTINFKLGLVVKPVATFLEFYAAHLRHRHEHRKKKLPLAKATLALQRQAGLKVAKTVYCRRNPGGPLPEPRDGVIVIDESPVAALKLTDLIDADFAGDYAKAELGTVAPESPEGIAILRRVEQELRYMGRLFWSKAAFAGLNVPVGLEKHLVLKGYDIPRRNGAKGPDFARIEAVHALVQELAQTDQVLYLLILMLAFYAGLRRGDIIRLKLENLNRSNRTGISIVKGKGGSDRHVPIPEWFYLLLEAHLRHQPDHQLLPGPRLAQEAAFNMAVQLLKKRLPTKTRNPLHELRKFYAGYICMVCRVSEIKLRMGHSNIRTTIKYYAKYRYPRHIIDLWEKAITVPALLALLAPTVSFSTAPAPLAGDVSA